MLVRCAALQKRDHTVSVSPCWRTASISESWLDAASLETNTKVCAYQTVSGCICHRCSMKPRGNTRVHVHFPADKSNIVLQNPINSTRNKDSAAQQQKEKSRYCSDCNTNTPVLQFLPALSTALSHGDRQVKYDKPMAWCLSP